MAKSLCGQESALRLRTAFAPETSSRTSVTNVTAAEKHARAYARWARAKANEGRRPQYILDAIRIRALDAMLDARCGR